MVGMNTTFYEFSCLVYMISTPKILIVVKGTMRSLYAFPTNIYKIVFCVSARFYRKAERN